VNTFVIGGKTCCFQQTGSGTNGKAILNLYNGSEIGQASSYLDIEAGGVYVKCDPNGSTGQITGGLWMNGSAAFVDTTGGSQAGSWTDQKLEIGGLGTGNTSLLWTTGSFYTVVKYPDHKADIIKVDSGSVTITSMSVFLTVTGNATGDATVIDIITSLNALTDNGASIGQPTGYAIKDDGNNLGIKSTH
jgi:hypothetical protein